MSLALPFLVRAVVAAAATLAAAAACGGPPPPGQAPPLDIRLAHDSGAERETARALRRLVETHDVGRWIFTRTVVIDERQIPHSHPVLTLHTRHLGDDDMLLAVFLHEQLHSLT